MSSPLPSDAAEAAWLRQVWGPGRAGLLPNQAQNVDLGPEQLQIFAARYLDTVGLCVAPLQQNDALVTVGDADVVLLTSGEKAKIFHEKSNDDAVIDFDNAINGFYVCLNPEKKWSVSWPSQSSQPAASANTTRSSVSADANEFSTHESYEISIKVPKSDRAGAYSDCATVAMGMGLVVTVMFETEHDVDVDDIDSDEVPRMNRDGHYRIKEYRVDCNFINQKGLVILKVCAPSSQVPGRQAPCPCAHQMSVGFAEFASQNRDWGRMRRKRQQNQRSDRTTGKAPISVRRHQHQVGKHA